MASCLEAHPEDETHVRVAQTSTGWDFGSPLRPGQKILDAMSDDRDSGKLQDLKLDLATWDACKAWKF